MNKMRVVIDAELAGIVPHFLDNRRRDVEALRRALNEEEWSEVRRISHQMIGSGSSYGFDEISEIGRGLSLAGQTTDRDRVERGIEHLAWYLDHVEVVCE